MNPCTSKKVSSLENESSDICSILYLLRSEEGTEEDKAEQREGKQWNK